MPNMSSNPRRHGQPTPARWLPGLVDLLNRRPELAGIGYTHIAREVGC